MTAHFKADLTLESIRRAADDCVLDRHGLVLDLDAPTMRDKGATPRRPRSEPKSMRGD